MSLKRMTLPEGWYPRDGGEVSAEVRSWEDGLSAERTRTGTACLAPHAGWFYSGALAYEAVSSLAQAETVLVLGGHLGPGDPLVLMTGSGFETPLGTLETDESFIDEIRGSFALVPSGGSDNTTEIQLPLVKALFPAAKVACLRMPPSKEAAAFGAFLADRRKAGKSFSVVASTDLTHYGPNYGFQPKGGGRDAVEWVKNENDAAFLKAVLGLDCDAILETGLRRKAACSPGAAMAAAAFASVLGLRPEVLRYGMSCDKHPSSSFVGYGALTFRA